MRKDTTFFVITFAIALALIFISFGFANRPIADTPKNIPTKTIPRTTIVHTKTIIEPEPTEPEPTEWSYDENLLPEENIFIYLTDYLGFPAPAACGIISNIAHETGWKFNPKAGSSSYCYGLIQWMGGRLSNLKRYCKENGKDYTTIQGQLDFMYWELTEIDTYDTYEYLMTCTDGAEAAYDAAWYFCYWYERPANSVGRSKLRGRDAMGYYDELVVSDTGEAICELAGVA